MDARTTSRTSRRGVELSLNLVILIVIGLIVAALVIYLVASSTGDAKTDLRSCKGKGGQCLSQCGSGQTGSTFFTGGCNAGEICCTTPASSGQS